MCVAVSVALVKEKRLVVSHNTDVTQLKACCTCCYHTTSQFLLSPNIKINLFTKSKFLDSVQISNTLACKYKASFWMVFLCNQWTYQKGGGGHIISIDISILAIKLYFFHFSQKLQSCLLLLYSLSFHSILPVGWLQLTILYFAPFPQYIFEIPSLSHVSALREASGEMAKPTYGCQVTIQSEQEKQMMKMYRREEKRERKRGKGTDDDSSEAGLTFDPREMRLQRYIIPSTVFVNFYCPLFQFFLFSSAPFLNFGCDNNKVIRFWISKAA